MRVHVDNQGDVGHSTQCVYTSTIVKAIGVTVTVEKVKRSSDRGSYTADMIISKESWRR